MLVYLVPVLVATAVASAIFGGWNLAASRRRARMAKRLELGSDRARATPSDALSLLTLKPLPPLLRFIALLGWAVPHVAGAQNAQWDLLQAGYRRSEGPRLFAGLKVLFALVSFAGGLVAASAARLDQGTQLVLAVLLMALGYFLPNIRVALRRNRRRQEIMSTLPDALDLMVICVEAGQGLNAALVSVGRQMNLHAPALAEELRLTNHEIRVGVSRTQALRNFAIRTGVDEARALAAVLIQSDRLGTSIGRALRVHAQSMRTRRRQRAEETARKTPVKLVFPLVLFIFPELLAVILAPAVIRLIRVLMASG